jgi:hypothetical protein
MIADNSKNFSQYNRVSVPGAAVGAAEAKLLRRRWRQFRRKSQTRWGRQKHPSVLRCNPNRVRRSHASTLARLACR